MKASRFGGVGSPLARRAGEKALRKKRDLNDEFRVQLEAHAVREAAVAVEHLRMCYRSPMHSRHEAAAALRRAADSADLAARLAGEQ